MVWKSACSMKKNLLTLRFLSLDRISAFGKIRRKHSPELCLLCKMNFKDDKWRSIACKWYSIACRWRSNACKWHSNACKWCSNTCMWCSNTCNRRSNACKWRSNACKWRSNACQMCSNACKWRSNACQMCSNSPHLPSLIVILLMYLPKSCFQTLCMIVD